MQAQRLPAARGWGWIVDGFALFRRNPPLLTFLVISYWFLLAAINVFPLIGQIAASLIMPALSVSVANGCREIAHGSQRNLGLAISGFSRNLPALMRLGALYLVASLAVFGVSTLFDGGLLMQAMVHGKEVSRETMTDPRLLTALQVALLLFLPVLMAYWFAPLLAAWAGQPAIKSLFFSFFACMRNWKAFCVYGVAILVISTVLPGVVLGIASAASAGLFSVLAVAVFLALMLVFVPTLFASFYVSACDIFRDFNAPEVAGGEERLRP